MTLTRAWLGEGKSEKFAWGANEKLKRNEAWKLVTDNFGHFAVKQ